MSDPNKILSITNGQGNLFSLADNTGSATVTFGHDFQTAIQKEIKEYLKRNLEIDICRWDSTDEVIIQVSLDGKVLSEKVVIL